MASSKTQWDEAKTNLLAALEAEAATTDHNEMLLANYREGIQMEKNYTTWNIANHLLHNPEMTAFPHPSESLKAVAAAVWNLDFPLHSEGG